MDRFFDNLQNINIEVLQQAINTIIINEENEEENEIFNLSLKNNEENKILYGCNHYLRRCKIVSPCCNQIFPCRLCHDEQKFDFEIDIKLKHKLDRFKIKEIICNNCNKRQTPKQYCENCDSCFGLYFCNICNLFDDIDKQQYHCDKCGICRINGKESSIHCDNCNICLSLSNYNGHKCIDTREILCPICMGEIFTSTNNIMPMICGHYIHRKCFQDLIQVSYKCPLCLQSIIDTKDLIKIIDEEIQLTEMPEDYKNMLVRILCNDCHLESEIPYHVVGLKCGGCGSYNTRKI